jgi:hypothetical protein
MIEIHDVVCSNLRLETGYPETFPVFFSTSKQMPVYYLGCDRFLPRTFQFIIHLLSINLTLQFDLLKASLNYKKEHSSLPALTVPLRCVPVCVLLLLHKVFFQHAQSTGHGKIPAERCLLWCCAGGIFTTRCTRGLLLVGSTTCRGVTLYT